MFVYLQFESIYLRLSREARVGGPLRRQHVFFAKRSQRPLSSNRRLNIAQGWSGKFGHTSRGKNDQELFSPWGITASRSDVTAFINVFVYFQVLVESMSPVLIWCSHPLEDPNDGSLWNIGTSHDGQKFHYRWEFSFERAKRVWTF